jgi:adenylylsulfate kinase
MSGAVVWLTGLPQSGKSTLARRLAAAVPGSCVLDGDDVRGALVPAPGYDATDRDDFYATLANLAALLAHQGHVVIVAATAHRRAYRDRARAAAPRFLEVHVSTPPEECARRDTKGLYRDGPELLPGVGVPYESPSSPDVIARGGEDEAAIAAVLAAL